MSHATPWVEGRTIGQVLDRTCRKHPENDALVFPALGIRTSYRELSRKVSRAARGLGALGIGQGHHVAVWATNIPQWVVLQMAAARIGAVLVTVNPAYKAQELKYVLHQSDVEALFLIDQFKDSDYLAILQRICPELSHCFPGDLKSPALPRLRWVVTLRGNGPAGAITWEKMLEGGQRLNVSDSAAGAEEIRPSDPINIQYTSGTTGFPKAAMLTHRNLLLNTFYTGDCQALSSADRICIPVPFYHCFGCVIGTLCAVVHGAAMVIPWEYFNARATLEAVEEERATVIYGVPTMFIAMLEDPSFARRDLTSLRTGVMAGSPCPIEVMNKVIRTMGVSQITIGYGQTESSPVITQTRVDDPIELRVETVGRPIPGVEVKIVDPETGMELGDEEQGELCARGHVVMRGYYRDPEATRLAIDEDNWLHTGDLALRHPNGYFSITGRLKEMVIRGGENIYPREIEEFLFTHPAIEQASVVGVPDPKFGEELCAWVRFKAGAAATEEEIREFCSQGLAYFKVPRYFRFVDEFPQTVTGKIQKFKIRDRMIQELENGVDSSP